MMLKLSTEKPILYNDKSNGWARYRIDFEDIDLKHDYALGWISPKYPTVEFVDHLDRIKDWRLGWVREILQEDTREIQRFRVRLYRKGLKDEDLFLLEERKFGVDELEFV